MTGRVTARTTSSTSCPSGSAEDAVLVLDDDDVEAVEPRGGGLCPALLPADPLVADLGSPWGTGDVDDVDDANDVLR